MKLSWFDYQLPTRLIAQQPINPRDHSRLLILDKKTGQLFHRHFYDLPKILKPGDVLVLNNSKVFPARLIGYKPQTNGKVEIFLLKKLKNNLWQCLAKGSGLKPDALINFKQNKKNILQAKLTKNYPDGTWVVSFDKTAKNFLNLLEQIGQAPLPPYIKKKTSLSRYQTTYAKITGSVAAPTAGLHFTPALLKKLKTHGVQLEFITLHVGLGTFRPLKTAELNQHQLHLEYASLDQATAQRLNIAKKNGQRIIAVGTTTVRTLETFSTPTGHLKPQTAWINTFIYPPYNFKFITALITNFHLPKSTLLILVSALVGRKKILQAYQTAINRGYRFFSFGDAMFIH
ncbi:MAG: tRNA preQ1(34) S-adenosylmethionine ribosyltransferase-isomerase QueA [Candidatus Buchananbacteria bacterium]